MDLSKLIVPTTEAVFEYPGMDGFKVTLCFMTRDELLKIRKKATTKVINKKTRQMEDDVDSDLFQELYIKSILKYWKGLKYKYVNKFLPLDMSGLDEEDELEFTPDNAITLMKNSTAFDAWVTDQLDDLENFTNPPQKD
jgi:hypothetical protein